MTPALFLLDPLPGGGVLTLDGDEGRHAARVKRILAGERVLVSDGRGSIASCTVESVDGDRLTLCVDERRLVAPPDPRFVIVQALPKGDRAELAVDLLTELGGDEIVPWAASRSVAQWRGDRAAKALAKWRRVAAEAGKQSRRAWLPGVSELASTPDVAARIATAACSLVLHESAKANLADAELPASGDIVVVVGPEGGIADAEIDAFAAAGATPVRLGEPVLRTSTAGAAALAALSVRVGRW